MWKSRKKMQEGGNRGAERKKERKNEGEKEMREKGNEKRERVKRVKRLGLTWRNGKSKPHVTGRL